MDAYAKQMVSYLLAQSWQIALLAAIVALISFALRNRSAHIRYLLWLIVLAKCLVPPLYSVPVPVLPDRPLIERLPHPATPETQVVDLSVKIPAPIEIEAAVEPQGSKWALPSLKETAVLVWSLGAFLFLVWIGVRAVRYTLWLRSRRSPLPDHLGQILQESLKSLKLKQLPRIWLTKEISQPFVWGLLRGSVYLPVDFLKLDSPERCRTILAHEISHVVRFDAAINVLQVLAQAVYWFHPFVWWMNIKIRQEREKCCDERAVVQLNALPEHYTNAIVEALAAERRSTRPIPSLAIVGSLKDIEERIRTMMKPGKKFYKCPNLAVILGVFILALLTVPTALVLTVRAQTQTTLETPTEPEEKVSTSLVEASLGGDLEEVKRLIAGGADVNATSPKYAEVKFTPLMAGANRGHAQVVQVLLENGAEVNATDFQGWTALYYAFWIFPDEDNEQKHRERAEVVKALIASGADVNKQCQGVSPLINAITAGTPRLGSVEALLDAGADIHFKDNRGLTPLYWAAFAGNRNVLELILERGDYPETIHLAACRGDLSQVQALLEGGADVNSKDEFGCTPLHWAVLGESPEVARLLITKGADINVTAGPDDLTPLMAARKLPIIEFLVSAGADIHSQENRKKLHSACSDGDIEVVEFLIDKGADINARNRRGATPLWIAASGDQKEIVELLLEKGADINTADRRRGSTPLWIAVRNGNKETAELLIKKGANLQAPDNQGRTPLDIAIERGHTEIVELLKKHEAKESTPSTQPKGPIKESQKNEQSLVMAIQSNNLEKVKELIAQGVDLNVRDEIGDTPLFQAVKSNRLLLVKALISGGADVNAKNGRGGTLLHPAALRGHKDMVELLIASGVDVNAKASQGLTALDLARRRGNAKIIEILTKAIQEQANIEKSPSKEKSAPIQEESGSAKSIHDAAADGDIEQVKLLIRNGADVNTTVGENARTPLIAASSKGHAEVVKLLLASGARVDMRDAKGFTPLIHTILNNENKEVVKALVAGGADVNLRFFPPKLATLSLAVWRWRLAIMEVLLEAGADVDAKDRWGYTPLHYAAFTFYSHKEQLTLILSKRGYPESVFIAACKGDLEKVRTLLADGDVNMKDEFGCTLLHWAALADSPQVADFLIAKGADVNARGGAFNLTPLLSAHTLPVVELLVSKGADIDAIGTDIHTIYNEPGRTKLHLACALGDRDMAEFLIGKGAAVNVRAAGDRTPLMQAAANGHVQVVELLIAKGADINARDDKGQTALSLAKEQGRDEIAALLSKHGAKE